MRNLSLFFSYALFIYASIVFRNFFPPTLYNIVPIIQVAGIFIFWNSSQKFIHSSRYLSFALIFISFVFIKDLSNIFPLLVGMGALYLYQHFEIMLSLETLFIASPIVFLIFFYYIFMKKTIYMLDSLFKNVSFTTTKFNFDKSKFTDNPFAKLYSPIKTTIFYKEKTSQLTFAYQDNNNFLKTKYVSFSYLNNYLTSYDFSSAKSMMTMYNSNVLVLKTNETESIVLDISNMPLSILNIISALSTHIKTDNSYPDSSLPPKTNSVENKATKQPDVEELFI